MKPKKKQVQVGADWSDPRNPIVFIDMTGVRPTGTAGASLTLHLTPENAAKIGKEIMQLGEFCQKEFKSAGKSDSK